MVYDMDKFRYIVIVLLTIFHTTYALSQTNALHAYEVFKHDADKAYLTGHYKNAYNMYRKLAVVGDKFAQYRLAVMYAEGQSVDPNPILAYAWSYVAAENEQPSLKNYHQSIKASLHEHQLQSADEHAADLLGRYGVFANALAARKMLDQQRRNCTGSRTGSRCDAVSAFTIGCSANFDRYPSNDCLRTGSLGLLSIQGSFPATLNQLESALDVVIQTYNPGQVELRELELIGDDLETQQSQDDQ